MDSMQPEDYDPFRYLFMHAFFIGIFLAFYNVLAVSLFVAEYGNEGLPMAYLLGGGIGLVATNIFSFVQKRAHVKILAFGTYAILLGVILAFLVVHEYAEPENLMRRYLPFGMFVLFAPVMSLVGLEFSLVSGEMFNLRQSKRLLPLVNAGEVSAAIIGNFSLSWLLTMLPDPYYLLWISLGGLVLILILLVFVFARFKDSFLQNHSLAEEGSEQNSTQNSFSLLSNKYILFIAIGMLLSTLVQYFADFGFMGGIKELSLEKSEAEQQAYIVTFFGIFFGFSNLAELVMSLVSGRLVKQFGIRFSLGIQPLAMFGALVLALVFGWLVPGLPVMVFLFLALNRLFDEVLRKTVTLPSFRLVYHSLPQRIKGSVQTLVEGMVRQLGTILSALFLMLVNYFFTRDNSTNLMGFIFVFVPLLAAWAMVAVHLAGGYKGKLQEALLGSKRETDTHSFATDGLEVMISILQDDDQRRRLIAMRLLNDLSPSEFRAHAPQMLRDWDLTIRQETLTRLHGVYGNPELISALKMVIRNSRSEEERELGESLLEKLTHRSLSGKSPEDLLDSTDPSDWDELLYILFTKPDPNHLSIVQRMLRSPSETLRNAAILLAPDWNRESIRSVFTETMKSNLHMVACASVAPRFGNAILENLEGMLRKDYSVTLHIRVVEVYARINSPAALALLLKRLNFHDLRIQHAVIRLLVQLRFTAQGGDIHLIRQKVQDFCRNLTWILACLADLQDEEDCSDLLFWLHEEEIKYREAIINLLGFLYNPDSLGVIRENLSENSTSSENMFALELLDNLLAEEIKPWILPLFEDIPEAQRVANIAGQFPQGELNPTDRLRDIVNHDFLVTNDWLKSMAISLLGKRSVQFPGEISAALFHPAALLFENAWQVLKMRNPVTLEDLLHRIPAENLRRLKVLEHDPTQEEFTQFKRMRMLAKIPVFQQVHSSHLIPVSEILKGWNLGEDEVFVFSGREERIVWVISGEIELQGRYFGANDYFFGGGNARPKFRAAQSSVVLMGEKYEFLNLMLNSPRLVRQWIGHFPEAGI